MQKLSMPYYLIYPDFCRASLGNNNVSSPSNEAIHDKYTGWQKQASLVIIEEMMSRGRLDLMNKLKPMITEPLATIRQMYREEYTQPNRFNVLAFTNYDDAIILDKDDRRYCIINSSALPKKPEYYKNLWLWTDAHHAQLLHWLLNRDLSDFNPKGHAPLTNAKFELIKTSLHFITQWMVENIEEARWPFEFDLISPVDLAEVLTTKFRKPFSSMSATKYLDQAGAKKLSKTKFVNSKGANTSISLWALRNKEQWEKCTNSKVRLKAAGKYFEGNYIHTNPLKDSMPM